jgi:hypothetical protein
MMETFAGVVGVGAALALLALDARFGSMPSRFSRVTDDARRLGGNNTWDVR